VKWGLRKNFKDGKVCYQYKSFLGYRKGADGQPEADEEQAAIVRRIFARYLMGHSTSQICKDLMADGIKTVRGKDLWRESVIQRMPQNEKYTGRMLLQRTVSTGAVQAENNGLMERYLYTGFHEAIISDEMFMAVQQEKLKRTKNPENTIAMCSTF